MTYLLVFLAVIAVLTFIGIGAELVKINQGIAMLTKELNKLGVLYFAANKKEIDSNGPKDIS